MSTLVNRDLILRGDNRTAFRYRGPEFVLSGPAGTGKTRTLLELVHERALAYDGCRILLARKERTTLTQTALVTFNSEVRPDIEGASWRATEQEYRYPNGSVVVVRGLDKEGRKVFSGQYDAIYVNEATELTETEWENLTSRLRNGVVPFQQIFGDCNPDRPTHWLRRRCEAGRCRMLESRHEDNPHLWDRRQQHWTPMGESYIGVLDSLTGPRKHRLRHGRWVQAEGVVYEGWDRAVHLIDRFPVPHDWPRFLSVDFGYTNPFACAWWALDPDGRLYLYREIYHTKRLVEDHARRILELSARDPVPLAVICDHDAEDRATLERHLGWATTPAVKEVSPGIQAVAARLRPAGDNKPRLFVLRDSLDERDSALAEAKRPCCTAEEFDGYAWDVRGGRAKGEEPVKENDHGMDALRYMVWGLDCDQGGPVEEEPTTVIRA